MTPQQLVGLAVRLFAIWLAITSLQVVGFGTGLNNQPGVEATNVPFLLAAALMVLVAALLWFFPMVVAHKLIPRTKFENVLQVPAREAVVVACIVFALWLFLARVLPSLAYYASLVAFMVHNKELMSDSEQFHFVRLAPIAIEFAVVLILAFKARQISAFLLADRTHSKDGERAQ